MRAEEARDIADALDRVRRYVQGINADNFRLQQQNEAAEARRDQLISRLERIAKAAGWTDNPEHDEFLEWLSHGRERHTTNRETFLAFEHAATARRHLDAIVAALTPEADR